MNKKANNVVNCLIYDHDFYKGYLILLIEVNLNGHDECTLMEKSIFIGSNEFYKLKTDLRIGDINKYDDFNQLDGIVVFGEIKRLSNGTHVIGQITLDEEYWEYCKEERQVQWVIKEKIN